jgi:hypothetical protein
MAVMYVLLFAEILTLIGLVIWMVTGQTDITIN